MANNKAFKVKNGLQAGRYLLSNGTETEGSVGYNIAGTSYDNKSFSVATQETVPLGLAFNSDGTAFYVVGYNGDAVFRYDLSTAYDISTASYSNTISVAAQATDCSGIMFNPAGTKMYITNNGTPSAVFQYSLSTAFDLTTATYDSVSFDFSTQDGSVFNPTFNSDGTKLYVAGNTGDSIYQYSLSTAYDISTMSYDSVSLSVASVDTIPVGVLFNSTGSVMYLLGGANNSMFEYSLTTPYDISTATYTPTSFSFTTVDTQVRGFIFKPDGLKLYAVGITNDTIYQYSTALYTQTLDLSTGTTFAFTPSGATTVSFTNPPASGLACAFTVEINGDGSAITWPASVKWHEATAPTALASKEVYVFITTDGGTTYYGKKAAEGVA